MSAEGEPSGFKDPARNWMPTDGVPKNSPLSRRIEERNAYVERVRRATNEDLGDARSLVTALLMGDPMLVAGTMARIENDKGVLLHLAKAVAGYFVVNIEESPLVDWQNAISAGLLADR